MEVVSPIVFEYWTPITDKSVPGVVPNVYIVSTFSRVYSNISKKYLLPVQTVNGYFRVNLTLQNKTSRYFLIHRIVMIEFHPIDNYKSMQVNHLYGDKSDNWDEHSEWTTGRENIIHAYRTGLKVKEKGEACSYATITNEQADRIGKLLSKHKYSHKEIAGIIGCPVHIVGNISSGSTWKDIYNKYELYKNKKEFNIYFSDKDLIKLCEYFAIHNHEFDVKADLYRAALKDLFDIKYTNAMSATMSRIYNHKTRTQITSRYNY